MTEPDVSGEERGVLLLADLDDTLFQTERKSAAEHMTSVAAWDRAGRPSSFQTPAQVSLIALFRSRARIVPVTGRNHDALARTLFRDDPFAITSFGAVIHTPAGPDSRWEARAQDCTSRAPSALSMVYAAVTAEIGNGHWAMRHSLVHDAGAPRYVSVKAAVDAPSEQLDDFLAQLRGSGDIPDDWRVFRTERSLALAPSHLGKEHAVRFFLEQMAPHRTLVIGVADSWSDAPFLGECDFAMTPRGSALHRGMLGGTGTDAR